MGIQNTKDFQSFIENREISDENERDIEQIIDAFSEYIVATNSEYVYNKTYLKAYVEDFILCQRALKEKYQILLNKILTKVFAAGIEKQCVISIDKAWIFENGKIKLSNFINPYIVKNKKMQIELEFIHDNGYVIAEEIDMDGDYEKVLDACVAAFIERREEIINKWNIIN